MSRRRNRSPTPLEDGEGSSPGDDVAFDESGDEYEETVRRQRAENAALLASLDLQGGGSSVVDPDGAASRVASEKASAAAEARKKKRAAEARERAKRDRENAKRKRVEGGGEDESLRPKRTSARLQGRTPAGLEESNKRLEEERKDMERRRLEAHRLLHQNHKIAALLQATSSASDDDDDKAKEREKQRLEALSSALQTVAAFKGIDNKGAIGAVRDRDGDDDEDEEEEESKDDKPMQALQAQLDRMELLAVNKVTPKRLYSAAWHPSTERELLFTGDKEGHISVWEPFGQRNRPADFEDNGDEEDADAGGITGDDGISWHLRIPQDSSPISCVKIPPTNPSKLFSSSYNSTLRKIDLEKGVSEQVFSFAGDADDEDGGGDGTLLSVFDFQRDANVAGTSSGQEAAGGNILWCGDHRGGVVRVDMREPLRPKRGVSNWQRWQLCEKKIGGLSMNPTSPHVLSVASLDQSVHLFDIRRLAVLPATPLIPTTYKHVDPDLLSTIQSDVLQGGAQLGYKPSKQASTSVDFSADGGKLAAVSYDDVVKVWDMRREWLDVEPDAIASDGTASRPTKNGASPATPDDSPAVKKGGLMRYFKRESRTPNRSNSVATNGAAASPTPAPYVDPRPYKGDLLQKPLVIPHNNQTGKWLTLFRVRWATGSLSSAEPAPAHFTIGGMSRRIEIYSSQGKLMRSLYDEEWHSAVPAVCVFHPSKVGRVMGGNASGRCVLWGVREDGEEEEEEAA